MFRIGRRPARLISSASLLIGLLPLPAAAFLHAATAASDAGRALYVQHCAACYGVDLEGQPDWRSPDADSLYPAPPHDETGHTWHHSDAMLIDYIARGGQAVLSDMGVTFTSGMPGFGSVLEEREIEATSQRPAGCHCSTFPKRIGHRDPLESFSQKAIHQPRESRPDIDDGLILACASFPRSDRGTPLSSPRTSSTFLQ